jgi:hypothetical protein
MNVFNIRRSRERTASGIMTAGVVESAVFVDAHVGYVDDGRRNRARALHLYFSNRLSLHINYVHLNLKSLTRTSR